MTATHALHLTRQGGFHVIYTATCRCGWSYEHYNAGLVREMYRAHKASP